MTRKLALLLPLVAALAFGCAGPSHTHTADVKNATCPISGKAVNPNSFVVVDGQKVYTCCDMCQAKVKADPKAAIAKAYPK